MNNKDSLKTNLNYTADSIKIFEGVKAVQQRPAMYLGSTDQDGFHHLVWEIMDNALDEYLAGFCTKIIVRIKANNVVVIEDNGRGIPPEIHPKTKISTIETVFTYLHAGGKFGTQTYQVSGGLHGVGSTVVNAMSSYFKVDVYKKGTIFSMMFEKGKKTIELTSTKNTQQKKTGTVIEFQPNSDLFDEYYEFNLEKIRNRLKQTAFINEKIKIDFFDEVNQKHETFHHKNGISDYLKELTTPQMLTNQHTKEIFAEEKEGDTTFKFIFRYTNNYHFQKIYSFCNNIRTSEGGSHEKGFRMALAKVAKKLMKKFNIYDEKKELIETNDIVQGILGIIVVLHPDPKFSGQTKTKLVNHEVIGLASRITTKWFEKFLLENPGERNLIFRKILSSFQMRAAISKKIEEIKDKDKFFENSTLPGKLADCSSQEPSERELFIVEGDSAGGSAKLGRDRRFQAILPLKGKIINSEKATHSRLFNNQEVNDLVISLGFHLKGEEFAKIQNEDYSGESNLTNSVNNQDSSDQNNETAQNNLENNDVKPSWLAKLRYHKVIIMTDADVDGSHIAVLLLTFLYKFFPDLIKQKYVYLAQPPLFKFKTGKKVTYLYTDEALKIQIAKTKTKYEIQRYKGLGEMNPGQLWDTTMDPEVRTLKQITVDDLGSTQEMLQLLMGKEVSGRKKFIVDNALFAANLDI